jgi:two-component system cell cycle sensor histidine kinase PleC
MTTFALRYAFYFAAVPAILALAARAMLSRDAADLSAFAMIAAAALFFAFMSQRLLQHQPEDAQLSRPRRTT